jgi:sugar phosphate isomerase/epimerase
MPIKISFSTNGWINSDHEFSSDWNTLFASAKELGYDGIELHKLSDPALSASGAPFSDEYISSTARRIASAKLTVA